MNKYKLDLLGKEFPFLAIIGKLESIDLNSVDSIKIKRGDKNLLDSVGMEDYCAWGDGWYSEYCDYFTVDSNNNIIQLKNSKKTVIACGEHSEVIECSIGQQLFEKKISPSFIVQCIKNDPDASGNGVVQYIWTIFRMDIDSLKAYHLKEIDRAAAALKAEIADTYKIV